jgi:hypothetical protein
VKRRSRSSHSRSSSSRRRNAALSVSAAALLVSAPLLSGCSTDSHPGAAAVVGGERISLSEVQSQVETVRDAQRERPDADDLIARSNALTRDTVTFLVVQEILERAAEEHGVEVSRRDVQEVRNADEQAVGGADALRQYWLAESGFPPLAGDQIDMFYRRSLLTRGLAIAIGAESDPNANQLVTQEVAETAEEIGVEINPRYGEWDAQNVALADADQPWLRVTEDTAA